MKGQVNNVDVQYWRKPKQLSGRRGAGHDDNGGSKITQAQQYCHISTAPAQHYSDIGR